jgi:Tail tubular protein
MATTLSAVNTMLRVIGQVPVTSIPDSGLADSTIAREVLYEYTNELQSEGFDFNTFTKVTLSPDGAGFIPITSDIIRVKPYYPYQRFTVRSNRLYNLDKSTDVFTSPVLVNMVKIVSFESLPELLARYVIIRSARVFGTRVVGSGEQNGYTQEDEARARSVWLNAMSEDMELNILSDSTHFKHHQFYLEVIRCLLQISIFLLVV